MAKHQANHTNWLLLKLAIVFLTRYPLTIKEKVDDQMLNLATGYFALVGLLVAFVSTIVFYLAHLVLPASIAVVLMIVAGIAFTGAFHEDGLADTADGLGGGWTVEAKLKIMKDSRIGTYGACALISALLLKFQLLVELSSVSITLLLGAAFLAHGLSRAFAVSVIGKLEYVQLDQESKTKPVAQNLSDSSRKVLLMTVATVLILSWITDFLGIGQIAGLLLTLLAIRWLLIKFIAKQLGGYTGDILGAFQQVFELSVYVILLVLLGA